MTSDPAFIEASGHLYKFLHRLSRHRVRPAFGRALSLEWDTPLGIPATLAHISPQGSIWTDAGVAKLPAPDAAALAHAYVEGLADDWGMGVNRESFGEVWTVCDRTDHLPRLDDVLYKLDVWADAIERLTDCLAVRLRKY